ncbi:YveK family protein [Candidatus Clostridium radicumherbarum]|uniref:YveK family protein n=1 Tax=Candidatus Clostridium radicumherbarum TaxID=3381662 RepID=A0ABW8TVP7_9CLOT
MELIEYLNILKKRWTLIVVITLAAALISGIVSYFIIKPTYKADISVIIQKETSTDASKSPSMSYNDVMMYQQLVKTYSEFVKSRTVAEDVIQNLNLKLSTDQLQNMVTAAPQGTTEFLTITVKSKDPKQAMDIANQLAVSLKDVSKNVTKSDNVGILDKAQLPISPDSPKTKLNIAIAFLLGLMVSVGVVFLIEYLDNTIKTSEDVEKLIGIPVIGTIPFVTDVEK